MINEQEHRVFVQHVLDCYPNEAVALVIDGKVIPVTNIAENKANEFKVAIEDYADAYTENRLNAVLHSHNALTQLPRLDPRTPSGKDLACWISIQVPFGIVATNGQEVSDILWLNEDVIEPLEGREFIHGKHDCYSIWRDYYRLNHNIIMRNYPRDYCWWLNEQNLYSDEAIASEGFIEVSKNDIQIGDVVLMRVVSPVLNHCAVVTGTNEIIHQLSHRLSGYDSLAKWGKYIEKCYRHESKVNK